MSPSPFISSLVAEEIRRLVADAIRDGSILSCKAGAIEVLKLYPNCGLDEREIANEIIMAAGKAGVPIELGSELPRAESQSTEQSKASKGAASRRPKTPL